MAGLNQQAQVLLTPVSFYNGTRHGYGVWNLPAFVIVWHNGQVQVLFTCVRFSNVRRHKHLI